MVDKRTRQERIKKWIKDQREFGKKFKIHQGETEKHIKMRLAGWDSIAGLNARAIKHMGYDKDPKIKISRYAKRKDYFTIWKKTNRKPYSY